jgi:hypothetical protein
MDSSRWCYYYDKRPEENTCVNVTPSGREKEGLEFITLATLKNGSSDFNVEFYLRIKE